MQTDRNIKVPKLHSDGTVLAKVFHTLCDCSECANHFRVGESRVWAHLTYTDDVSQAEGQKMIDELLERIEKDRAYLSEQCLSYGTKIEKFWVELGTKDVRDAKKRLKKSRLSTEDAQKIHHKAREKFLLEVEPSLCQFSFPEGHLAHQYRDRNLGIEIRNHHPNVPLAPYINVETLVEDPSRLLGLLKGRLQYTPQDWLPFDSLQLQLHWDVGSIPLVFCVGNHCVSMSGSTFGSVVDFEVDQVHNWEMIGFPRAKAILDSQAFILGFLRGMVGKIVETMIKSLSSSADSWLTQQSPQKRYENTLEFASSYLNQPFSSPPLFDIDHLVSLAESNLNAKRDHLWLCQTDPDYMLHWVKEIQRSRDIILSETKEGYRRCARDINKDIHMTYLWDHILSSLQSIKELHSCIQLSMESRKIFGGPYEQALGALEVCLVEVMSEFALRLTKSIPHRPGFCKNWAIKDGKLYRTDGVPTTMTYHKDPLDWCISQMFGRPDDRGRYGLAMLFAFLDMQLSKSTAEERNRIDEYLYTLLSDYASLHEIYQMLGLHRPRSAQFPSKDVISNAPKTKGWQYFAAYRKGAMDLKEESTLGSLLNEFFQSPQPKGKRDQKWWDTEEASRAKLNSFWSQVRESQKAGMVRCGLTAKDVSEGVSLLSAARHAEHISILARQKESIHKKPVGKAAATDSQKQQQFIGAQTQWGPSEPRKSTKVVVDTKTKIKTRSEQKGLEHVLAGLEIDDTPEEPAIPEIVVPVKKSAYEIFQRMFTSEKPRKTDWDVFVAAMGETGFEASRSGGSPVSFQPSETSAWSGKGKIVVHRPHPVAELSMFKLVSIGKRMNKWFGWTEDSFVLERKT